MTLILFKYILPSVIGYTLFLGLSGRANPFQKPQVLNMRPAWFLGLWTGMAITLVLMLAMNMAYHLSTTDIQAIARPTIGLLAILLIPGFAAYFWYKSDIKQQLLDTNQFSAFEYALESDPDLQEGVLGETDVFYETDMEQAVYDEEEAYEHDEQLSLSQKVFATLRRLLGWSHGANQTDADPDLDDIKDQEGQAPEQSPELANQDQQLEQVIPPLETEAYHDSFIEAYSNTQLAPGASTVVSPISKPGENEQAALLRAELDLQRAQSEELLEAKLLEREEVLRAELIESTRAEVAVKIVELETALQELRSTYDGEIKLRQETENHLRITRKALSQLEATTRDTETVHADALIAMEQKLEDSIKAASIAETNTLRAQERREQIEKELFTTKQSVLAARKDARKSTAARAKVLATANKAIAFARQTVEARTNAEADLSKVLEHMNNQQTTIASLNRALEAEKNKSREEVAYLSKQLLLREKELEQQTIIAQSATDTVTTRLVKKVAKAARAADQSSA